ncbi:MAG TPA: ABC transporter permease [Chryseosolibacter sp.]|nr:ABC transporter permease [Chryseosolibacter sp.]
MLKSYLILAFRNLVRHKFYAALNISGLACGLTASLLIGLYIYDEITFDTFHADYENIYHVGTRLRFGGQEIVTSATCPPLAPAMLQQIAGVEKVTRLNPWPIKNVVMRYEDKSFTERNAIYADSNFFDFFSFRLLQGNAKTVLKEPHTIVLTPSAANRYFGNEVAIGKIITVGNSNEAYTVTGIVAPAPSNSHIQFDMLLSLASEQGAKEASWGNTDGTYTYFRKSENASLASVTSGLDKMVRLYIHPEIEATFGITFQEFDRQGNVYKFFSYALSDSHLYHPEIADGLAPSGDVRSLYMFGAVGIFILLIACINFMNLSTARSARRAREVGLRKTFGSAKSRLVVQFISESMVYVFVATVLSIAAAYLLLPGFEMLSGKSLSVTTILAPRVAGGMLLIFFLVALLAGSYPAFYLTSFKPIEVLKGKLSAGMKSKSVRSVLVVVQFSISIVLMICTLVVYDQLTFMQEKDIGLDKHNVLVLQNTNRLGVNQDVFLESVSRLAGVLKASYCDNAFPEVNRAATFRPSGTTRDIVFQVYAADYGHIDVLNIDLVQGRYFSMDFASDSMGCLINESAAKAVGWTDPLNRKFEADGGGRAIPVIGVIRDFNFESFKTGVRPLIVFLKRHGDFMHVRYAGNPNEIVPALQQVWQKLAADSPFEFTFLDQNFDQLFREEQRLGNLFTVMSSIAIFVACLGLLGLASFTAEQRTREIGIRKVMGASVTSITSLLSREFMVLVGLAFILACILGWYAMDQWLSTFAYRIRLSPAIFLMSGFIAAVIAWITVSYHFIRAAKSNPCDAIRHD